MSTTLQQRLQQQEAEADRILASLNAPAAEPQVAETQAADPTPVEAPAPEAVAPAPAPVQPVPAPAQDWEHKYRTLQGIHNSHMAELKRRLQSAEQMLQERAAEPPKPTAPEIDTKKDAEVFGEDLVQMVVRIVDTKFGHVVNTFDERLKAIEARFSAATQTVAKTGQDLFLSRLEAAVPDYAAINVDERFLEWLTEIDPIYGVERQAALDDAVSKLDAGRASAIFKAFKASVAVVQAPAQTPAQQQLERQVAPRQSAAAPAHADTPKLIPQSDVTAFYNAVRRGEYRGKEALAAQIEAELNKALAEGRVV